MSMISALTLFLSLALSAQDAPAAGGGEVERPFLGVRLLEVPPPLAAHLEIEGGALVADVVSESPAEAAGIRPHDVVVAAGGEAIASAAALQRVIRGMKPGEKLAIEVLRDAERIPIEAVLGSVKAVAPAPEEGPGFLGVSFGPVPPSVALHLGIEDAGGASVTGVLDDSPAAKAGIRTHDIILEVAGERLAVPDDLPRILADRRAGDAVEIVWIQRGKERRAPVMLASRSESAGPGVPGPFGLDPRLPGRGDRFELEGPRHSLRGRLLWRDVEGKEHVFELPEFGVPDPRFELRRWRENLDDHWKEWKGFPDELQGRIEKLLEEYEKRFGDDEWPRAGGGDRVERRSHHAVSRMVADGYDITVEDADGRRTFTVKKDGETIAEDVDFDQLDSQPADVQERVRKAAEGLPAMQRARVEWRRKGEEREERGKQTPERAEGALKV